MRQALGSAAGSKLVAMSLDGLRAWIGLVERKLTMRTRVFLVLVAIAVGGAAAGIYLAIDAPNNSVSKADAAAERKRQGDERDRPRQLERQHRRPEKPETARRSLQESGRTSRKVGAGFV